MGYTIFRHTHLECGRDVSQFVDDSQTFGPEFFPKNLGFEQRNGSLGATNFTKAELKLKLMT